MYQQPIDQAWLSSQVLKKEAGVCAFAYACVFGLLRLFAYLLRLLLLLFVLVAMQFLRHELCSVVRCLANGEVHNMRRVHRPLPHMLLRHYGYVAVL